jgi:hypothetical protein
MYITFQVKRTYSTQYLTNATCVYDYSNKALVQSFHLEQWFPTCGARPPGAQEILKAGASGV